MTPILRGEEAAPPADKHVRTDKTTRLLDASFDSLAKVLEESRDKVTEAENQRKLALEELDARRKAHAETQRELAELKRQLATTRKSEAHWKNQSEKLSIKLAAGEQAHANLAKFRDQMAATLEEFSSLKGDIANVRGELEAPAMRVALRKENEKLKSLSAGLEKKLNATRQQLSTERKRHAATRQELIRMSRQNDILGNVLAESRQAAADLEARLEDSRSALQEAKSLASESVQHSAGLEKRASQLQFEHGKMSKSLASAEMARKGAQGKLAGTRDELEKSRKQIDALAAKVKRTEKASQAKTAAFTQRQQAHEKQIALLKAAVAKDREALGQQEQRSNQQLAALKSELEKSLKEQATLKNDTQELRKISGLTSERLKKTKQQLKALEEEKQTLREALEKREAEIANLQARLEKSTQTARNEEIEE
jgi:chromosome segregation ATPase